MAKEELPPIALALTALADAYDAIRRAIDYLQTTPEGRRYTEKVQEAVNRQRAGGKTEAAAAKRMRHPAVPSGRPLPSPVTPAPKPPVVLKDATRAENQDSVTAIAKRIMVVIGVDSPMVRQSLVGQVALEKIPADDQMIDDAIEAARRP